MLQPGEIGVLRRLDARHRNGVHADAELPLQVPRVHDHRQQLVAPVVEPEQRAHRHVVDARFHRAVQRVQAPAHVALDRVPRMHRLVGRPVVRLLEHLERADARLVQLAQLVHAHRRGVDVHPADRPHADPARHAHLVDLLHALGDVVGVGRRMLAEHDHQPLVADLAGEELGLLLDLGHREHLALDRRVRLAEPAVGAVVHAEIAAVERREGDHPVVVDRPLGLGGGGEHLLPQPLVAHAQQHGGLLGRERGPAARAAGQLPHESRIRLGLVGEQRLDQRVVHVVLAVHQVAVDLFLADDRLGPFRRGNALVRHAAS